MLDAVVRLAKTRKKALFSFFLLFSFLFSFSISASTPAFLNFKYSNAPISEVIKNVANITGKGVVFSGIETRITWIQKFPKIALFDAFKSVLNSQGYYLAREKSAIWSIRKITDGVDVKLKAWAVQRLENVIAVDLEDAVFILFGDRVRITGSSKGGRVAVLGGQIDLLPDALNMIQNLDRESKPDQDYTVYKVKNILLRDLTKRLVDLLGKDIGLAPNPWSKEILIKGPIEARLTEIGRAHV